MLPPIELKRRENLRRANIQNEIKLIEDMLSCFTSQKVINKLKAERDELVEILGLYSDLDELDILRDEIRVIYS